MKEIKIFNTIKNELQPTQEDFRLLLSKLETSTVQDYTPVKSFTQDRVASPYFSFKWLFVGVAATAAAFVITILNIDTKVNGNEELNSAMLAINAAESVNLNKVNEALITDQF